MQDKVLGPIGMTASSFEQPQPPARAGLTAAGYYGDRSAVRGRWHLYPEMAAAGLWTTATDLAKFAIEIQETLAGRGHGVISPAMARQYVTSVKNDYGLGIGLNGSGRALTFSHGGRDEGFDALLIATAETGQAVAIMINANENSGLTNRIFNYVARTYRWPDGSLSHRISRRPRRSSPRAERACPVCRVLRAGGEPDGDPGAEPGRHRAGHPDRWPLHEDFLALDSAHFGSNERNVNLRFTMNASGSAYDLIWRVGEPNERRVPRVAPLPSSLQPVPEPDSALHRGILASLHAMIEGGPRLEAASVPDGTKRSYSRGFGPPIEGLDAMSYLGEENVTGRGILRHGSQLARVRFYRLPPKDGQERYLLVHLTAAGLVADLDPGAR